MKNIKLEDYQVSGVNFMLNTNKCLNLDDPGMGKTIQSIAFAEKVEGKILIVVKPENLSQWLNELTKFSTVSFTSISGKTKKQREKQYREFKENSTKILVINYNKILYDTEEIFNLSNTINCIIFDEAFQLKNTASKYNELFYQLTKNIKRVVMLTATPVGKTLYDFFGLLKVLRFPGLISEEDFIEEFCITETIFVRGKNGATIKLNPVVGSKNIEEFNDLISDYFIKRSSDGRYNIEIEIQNEFVELTEEQRELIIKVQDEYNNIECKEEQPSTVKSYSTYQKIVDCPYLVGGTKTSPKINNLISAIKNSNEQIVVYAKFITFQNLIKESLVNSNITAEIFNGEKTKEEKDKIINNFNSNKTRVLIISDAGKVGLNLQVASTLFVLNTLSSPSDIVQLVGRIYRIGQKNNVKIVFITTNKTTDINKQASAKIYQKDIEELFSLNQNLIFDNFNENCKKVSFSKIDYKAS